MAKRPAAPAYTTNKSAASWFPNQNKKPELVRRRLRFPMGYDRVAESNIPFTDELLHREWAGKNPTVSENVWDEMIRAPQSLGDSVNLWRNPAVAYQIPDGYIATSSGIEPLINPPGTQDSQQGYQLDFPGQIDDEWENDTPSGFERYEHRFPKPDKQFVQSEYTPINPGAEFRIIWQEISYHPPVEPQVRFPNSVFRKRKDGRFV